MLRRELGKEGKLHFPLFLDYHDKDWQPHRVDSYSAEVADNT